MANKMTAAQLHENMYQFWKSGNSLETMFKWLKDAYNNDASVLMSSFMKKYSSDKKLKTEFNKSCFIENIHAKVACN